MKLKLSFFLNLFLGLIVLCTFSCKNSNEKTAQEKTEIDPAFMKERLIEANKHLSRTEKNQIDSYIQRRGWTEMNMLDNGLRIWEYKKGDGSAIGLEEEVSLKYTLELINGIQVYSSEKDGIKTFFTGKAKVERGLDEAVMLLHRGSKAKIIIPSYLGFGFVGDGKQIPKYAILIYDIEVL